MLFGLRKMNNSANDLTNFTQLHAFLSLSLVMQAKHWACLFWNTVLIFHTLSKAHHQVNLLEKETFT